MNLTAERDVVRTAMGWEAATAEPWLRLETDANALAGRWIELTYDAGLADAVSRPLLRCVTPEGVKDEILPGAALGRAIWIGRISPGTGAILISPVGAPGPFAFRIAGLRVLSLTQLAARGWGQRPKYVLLGLGFGLIGNSFEAERRFRRALHSTPLAGYRRWAEARRRAPEWDGFDSLPPAARDGLEIHVMATQGEPKFLASLAAQLRAQPWLRWTLAAPAANASSGAVAFSENALLAERLADLRPRDLVLVARPGDDWIPEALAMAGAAALRDDSDVYYGDEEIVGAEGLRLKPDWSPILARFTDLIGRAWVARADWARREIGARRAIDVAGCPLPVREGLRATHLRRLLLRRAGPAPIQPGAGERPPPPAPGDLPCATIIIPTRDLADLLRRCVESLRRVEGRSDFEAIVVDNGSRDAATLAYLSEIRRDGRFRVIERPGPFNFSALCNAGAAAARAGALVFLNNDVEALSPDWLDRLIAWTGLPTVGAVGAKLIYPDGRLQHAGVTIGVDGHAAHFERFRPPETPGYFGRLA